MEQYTKSLETIVYERTCDLIQEKEKSDSLLSSEFRLFFQCRNVHSFIDIFLRGSISTHLSLIVHYLFQTSSLYLKVRMEVDGPF